MPPTKPMIDSRSKRIRCVWGEATYTEVMRGLSPRNIRGFKPPSPETRAIMRRTVEAYLAGKLKPYGGREVGHRCMQRRVHRYTFQTEHPKKPGMRATRSAECPLEIKYLSGVFFHTRDDDGETHSWETGEAIRPWMTISASDGSAVRLYALMNGDDGLGPGVTSEMDDEGDGFEPGSEPDDGGEPDEDEDTEEAVHGHSGEGKIKKKKSRRR